jgi:S-formylglutathione hydrolase FrmB
LTDHDGRRDSVPYVSLISLTFRNGVIAATVAVALATVLLWNRIPGPRAVRAVTRALFLLAGQFLAVVALLVTVNIAAGGLIVSVGDLLGNQTTDGASMTGQAGQVTLKPVAALSTRNLTGTQKFIPSEYSGYLKTTLKGTASGVTSTVYVYLPADYAKNPNRQYPVLELLHGVPDSPGAWMAQMHAAKRLMTAVSTGTVHPFILVIPEVTPNSNHSSMDDNEECTDVSSTDKIETWLTQDVRNMVLDNFRAIGSASGWGLMGYSTGGYCAANLVLKHPDLYKAAVSISGYYSPESSLVTSNSTLAQENNPIWRIQNTRTPAVSLLMTASKQDPIDPPSEAQDMINAAKAGKQSKSTEVEQYIAPLGGGHNQSAWEKMLPTAFRWLSERLSGPVG